VINIAVSATRIGPRSHSYPSDLLDGSLRAQVLWANQKDHGVHESEGMLHHEPLDLSVVPAAPVGPRQERPPDLDLALFLAVPMKAGRPNPSPCLSINGNQGTTGGQGLAKELPETGFFMAILDGMLFPNERIGRDGIEVIKVIGANRPEFDKLALQHRLIVKGHAVFPPQA